MFGHEPKKVTDMKLKYPAGTRIELIKMEDKYTTLKRGDKGTVTFVDDGCQIHMKWDNGSSLALLEDVDTFNVIKEDAD